MAEVRHVLAYKKQSNLAALWEEFQAQRRFVKVLIFFLILASISSMALAGTSLTLVNYAAEPVSTQTTLLAFGGRHSNYNYPTPTPTPAQTRPSTTTFFTPTDTPTPTPTLTPTPVVIPAPSNTNSPTTTTNTTVPTATSTPTQTSASTPVITPTTQASAPRTNSVPVATPTPTPTPAQNAIQQVQQSVVSTIDNFFHIPAPATYTSPDSSGNDSSIPIASTPTPIPTNITLHETNFFKFAFDVIAKADSSLTNATANLFSGLLKSLFPTPAPAQTNNLQ